MDFSNVVRKWEDARTIASATTLCDGLKHEVESTAIGFERVAVA
jgi:hypothetical protein